MPHKKIARVIFSVFALALCAGGCAPTWSKSAIDDEVQAIRSGERSIVLLRVLIEEGSRPINWRKANIRVINRDTLQSFENIFFTPSEEDRKEGWLYLKLEPGQYYVEVMRVQEGWIHRSSLQVKKYYPVIYAGSLYFLEKPSQKEGFRRFIVSNERDLADGIARRLFGRYGELSVTVMQPLDHAQDVSRLFPVGITSEHLPALAFPSWQDITSRRAIYGHEDVSAREILRTEAAAYYYLVYAPPAMVISSLWGKIRDVKYKPCQERLLKEIQGWNPMAHQVMSIEATLKKYGPAYIVSPEGKGDLSRKLSDEKVTSVLQVTLRNIGIRECKKSTDVLIEMELQARMFDVATRMVLYDKSFMYVNSAYRDLYMQDYENEVCSPSDCRGLDYYCGDAGVSNFKKEINTGLQAIAEQIYIDLDIQ